MQRYKNISGESGVTAYELRSSSIVLQFADGARCLYTYASTGRDHVQAMKQLAKKGRGLTTYVTQHVGGAYAMRLA